MVLSGETTPLSATQVNCPSSERDTLEMLRVDEELFSLELPSVMLIRPSLVRAEPLVSQDMSGAGTPNAVHCSSAVPPTTTSGPRLNTVAVICEASA